MNTVKTLQFSINDLINKEPRQSEVLRYMGTNDTSAELESLISKGIFECKDKLSYRVAYREFPVKVKENKIDLGYASTHSCDLAQALEGCDSIILFAATIGLEIDRAIYKHGRLSPSLALCIQAIGAERIEELCDSFCKKMQKEFSSKGKILTERFSAGYGDLPIELQKDIFAALMCEKHIGLTLTDSLLMSPTKSVTARIGVKKSLKTKEKQ